MLGENDPDMPEFKFIYFNGKTRQNTYEGAFVYSRSRTLEPESMAKVYSIAKAAGMNTDQFCKIRNGCFADTTNGNNNLFEQQSSPSQPDYTIQNKESMTGPPSNSAFRGIMASTKVSELLGVEAVSARDDLVGASGLGSPTSIELQPVQKSSSRPWWYEAGDYLENPHRHFEVMKDLRQPMVWPEDLVASKK